MPGCFITVEGGEGTGKSTVVAALCLALKDRGLPVLHTREPGGTPTANRIRQVFASPEPNDPILPLTELLLVNAARTQHVARKIRPTIASGTWVVCDRFVDSSRVYQGTVGNIAGPTVESVADLATGGLEPDITFLLDCPTSVAAHRLRRATQSGERSGDSGAVRYDSAEDAVHEKIRRGFLALAERFPHRIRVIDAAQSAEKVLRDILICLEDRISKANHV